MPYTEKEKKLYSSLVKQYGKKKANQVYHAMATQAAKGEKHTKVFGEKQKEKMAARLRQSVKKNKFG